MTKPCDDSIAHGRMKKANEFLRVAEDAGDLADDSESRDAVISLYVLAGIAAADVICCKTLGEYSMGSESHTEAINVLEKVRQPDGRELSKSLKRLLDVKTKAAYAHRSVNASEFTRAQRAAEKLVQAARGL